MRCGRAIGQLIRRIMHHEVQPRRVFRMREVSAVTHKFFSFFDINSISYEDKGDPVKDCVLPLVVAEREVNRIPRILCT